MTVPFTEVLEVLRRVRDVDAATPTTTLRAWRGDIVRASVLVSYALGIYSLDIKILERASTTQVDDVLGNLVADLPELLASGWMGGGWSLAPDASISVAAANEFDIDSVARRLELHGEMVTSDLRDHAIVHDLIVRIDEQRQELSQLRDMLSSRLRLVQQTLLGRYATGDASVDDWMS